jgi:ligand-binding sensor domain-containing protein
MTGKEIRPTPIYNRPGLAQLAYRIGDYASFRQRLLASLPMALRSIESDAPLAKLTTRDGNDPAIALLDAWAVVADVLTFYQERIANEGYLRTATERRSVLELARAIAYELDPGVAASTYLSFKVEDAPGSPTVVPIPARTQIMSVPLKDELPQIFETTEDFTAYLEWNGLRPRPTRPQKVQPHTRQLYLAGTSTQLQAGDWLLLVDNVAERKEFLLPLSSVTPNTKAGYTLVRWPQSLPPVTTPLRRPQVFAFRQQARLFGYNAPNWEQMPAAIKLAAVEKGGGTIQGGVFRSDSDGLTWQTASQGLPNSNILCLVAQGNLLFAGTPDKGIFRSKDNGQTWEAANEGLLSMNILALHIADDDNPDAFNGAIFAGTPNGGVYRSKDQGQNWVMISSGKVQSRRITSTTPEIWESIKIGLPNTVVRTILTYRAFSRNHIIVGTDEGIYRSTNLGQSWEPSRALSTAPSLDRTFWVETATKTIYTLIQIVGSTRIVAGTDRGIITSPNNGRDWNIRFDLENILINRAIFSLAQDNDFLYAGTDQGIYRRSLSISSLSPSWLAIHGNLSNNNFSLERRSINFLAAYSQGSNHYLFAATIDGIFVSVNSNDTTSGNVTWKRASQLMATQAISALAVDGASKHLYAGAKFGGFLATEAKPEPEVSLLETSPEVVPSKQEWPDFVIQDPLQIDLDALYPQLLADSWVVLMDDRNPQDPEQRADPRYGVRRADAVANVDRQDFGLSGKITRIELDRAVDPTEFGLRSTRVLGRSAELPLAPEPLTVEERQHDIFADPLIDSTVYLQGFVPNLQPKQMVMVNGKPMRMVLSDVGGVLRSRHPWQPLNQGLNNLTVNTLAIYTSNTSGEPSIQYLLATTNEGAYQVVANQEQPAVWEPILGLRFETVHSLLVSDGFLLFGADLDLYRTESPIAAPAKVDIPIEATVLTFSVHTVQPQSDELPAEITLASLSGITLTLGLGAVPGSLEIGAVITVSGQTRIVTGVEGSKFYIDRTFEPKLSEDPLPPLAFGGSVVMAGTDQGILRSTDQGKTWEYLKSLRGQQINCLLAQESESSLAEFRLEVYAGTDRGLYLSSDSGETWNFEGDLWNLQDHSAIYALARQGDVIWIGTGRGLYSLEDATFQKLSGLSHRTILSLQVDGTTLYAGTDQGIYRSTNREQPWDALDAGLTPATGRALLLENNRLLVGTEAGIFSVPIDGQRNEPVNWSRSNAGFVNSQVTALASSADGTEILAGTTAGLYRSTSGGRTWAPFDDRLKRVNGPEKLAINAVLRAQNGRWLVGTPEGVFVYGPTPDDPETQAWQLIGRDSLPYPNILTLAQKEEWLFVGTVNGGLFKLDLAPLTFATQDYRALPPNYPASQRWQPTGLSNTDVQAIAFHQASDANYTNYIFAGTVRDGIFRSDNEGNTWEQITNQRSGRGSLTSEGIDVTWSITEPHGFLQTGDVITAAGQTRTISKIDGTHITVDDPFHPNLSANTEFTINTGLTNRDITFLGGATDSNTFVLYAGTAGSGVFRSNDGGYRWQQVIANLEDLTIRCLLCEEPNILWAGTATAGVFRSTNRGDLWAAVNLNLTNTDVRAMIRPSQSTLLVGGLGFLRSEDGLTVKPIQRQETMPVIKPPQLISDRPDTDRRWLLRDKEGFLGTLDTTAEQVFPLLPADEKSALISEEARIKHPPTDQQQPILTLQAPLTYSYDPATVEIAANVVPATHGETAMEVLGSGDGNASNQRFALRKPPLTYVAAVNARGSDSTLELRVDGVLWEEVAALYSLKPQAQNYILRIEDDGTTTVTFGDGTRGARPPSGQENITARYRSGIGTDGNVAARRLSILKTRPQGIAEVTNALAATGAANRESLEEARTNAPPTARTLGRIVSLQDFQDFAQGFVGIGKAQAVALWDGSAPVVHITIAGAEGAAVPETSQLYQSLVAAIDQARDPLQQVQVALYQRLFFNLEARVLLDARYQVDAVEPQLTQALLDTFAFPRRGFGQAVTSAEVITALQQVKGIIAVDLDALYGVGRSRALNDVLTAQTAFYEPDTEIIQPAELFLLSPVGIQLTFVTAL